MLVCEGVLSGALFWVWGGVWLGLVVWELCFCGVTVVVFFGGILLSFCFALLGISLVVYLLWFCLV